MRACDRRRPPHKELCEIKSRLSAAGTLLPRQARELGRCVKPYLLHNPLVFVWTKLN